MNVGNRESCRELLKNLNILPLHLQYILSLVLFVVKKLNMFKSNSLVQLLIQEIVLTCISPQYICLRYKRECITQESKSSIAYLQE